MGSEMRKIEMLNFSLCMDKSMYVLSGKPVQNWQGEGKRKKKSVKNHGAK